MSEKIDHPSHYGGAENPHEHVKCMEAIGFVHNAFLYNCTKYLWRAGKKDGAVPFEDLKKARWYLDREIQRVEGESRTLGAQSPKNVMLGDVMSRLERMQRAAPVLFDKALYRAVEETLRPTRVWTRCPKVSALGNRCLLAREHEEKHRFHRCLNPSHSKYCSRGCRRPR